jgi:hypothetical protein
MVPAAFPARSPPNGVSVDFKSSGPYAAACARPGLGLATAVATTAVDEKSIKRRLIFFIWSFL